MRLLLIFHINRKEAGRRRNNNLIMLSRIVGNHYRRSSPLLLFFSRLAQCVKVHISGFLTILLFRSFLKKISFNSLCFYKCRKLDFRKIRLIYSISLCTFGIWVWQVFEKINVANEKGVFMHKIVILSGTYAKFQN